MLRYKPRLIGLCGDIGSGKSTVAEYLHRKHGYQRKAFALALKHAALDVFGPMGMKSHHVFGTQEQKNEQLPGIRDAQDRCQTGRRILEWLGTEGFRTIDPDVWVKSLLGSLDFGGQRYVIEDVRFPNEAVAIRQQHGVVWEVVRLGGPNHGGPTGHESDNAWRTLDKDAYLTAHHGNLSALFENIEHQLEGLK